MNVCKFFGGMWIASLPAFLLAFAMTGCAYKGAKVVEGTDLAVGVNVPASEGTFQLQLLNYLSGFRLGVDRNANMVLRYTVAETNDYFGCIHTRVMKTIDASVEPVEIEEADGCKCADGCTCPATN